MRYMPDIAKISDLPECLSSLRQVYQTQMSSLKNESGFSLLSEMLLYDPTLRISCEAALTHKYFAESPRPGPNSFISPATRKSWFHYPQRKLQIQKL